MNRNIGVHEQRSHCRHMQSCFVSNSLRRRGILLNCHRIDMKVSRVFSEAVHFTSSLPTYEMSEDNGGNVWICL